MQPLPVKEMNLHNKLDEEFFKKAKETFHKDQTSEEALRQEEEMLKQLNKLVENPMFTAALGAMLLSATPGSIDMAIKTLEVVENAQNLQTEEGREEILNDISKEIDNFLEGNDIDHGLDEEKAQKSINEGNLLTTEKLAKLGKSPEVSKAGESLTKCEVTKTWVEKVSSPSTSRNGHDQGQGGGIGVH